MVTDGQCTHDYLSDLHGNATALREIGNGFVGNEEYQVWSIGVGQADRNELVEITGDEKRVLSIQDFRSEDSLNKIKLVRKDGYSRVCLSFGCFC